MSDPAVGQSVDMLLTGVQQEISIDAATSVHYQAAVKMTRQARLNKHLTHGGKTLFKNLYFFTFNIIQKAEKFQLL